MAVSAKAQSPADRQILVMVNHPTDDLRAEPAYGDGYSTKLRRSSRQGLARQIALRNRLTIVDDWAMPMIGVDCFVMRITDGRTATAAADQVSHDADVEWAEPVAVFAGLQSASYNDALYPAEPAAAQWHLADLHRIASGRGIRVAVVDSGIDANHPDLAGQVLLNRNFVTGQKLAAEQHGTAVAGIIAAKAGNRIGIAGVAPGARLIGLRACWQQRAATACDTLSLAKALYFAVENKPDVINLSLSGPDARLLREILKIAYARGIAVVAAYDSKLPDGGFPASVPGVIAVSDAPARNSADNVYVSLGRDVPTTEPGGRWFVVNGSSFAAAHVSGLVALVREWKRSAPLMLVAQRRGGPVDACATLSRLTGKCCTCAAVFVRASGR
jgi:subtilisin family serine protease